MKKSAEILPASFCRRLKDALAQQPRPENTAAALARKSKISVRQIMDYVNEKPDVNPRPATIAILANALGVTFNWLAYGEGSASDRPTRPFIVGNEGGVEVARADVLRESQPVYAPRATLALHELVAGLARHIGCPEDDVLEFVLRKMKEARR